MNIESRPIAQLDIYLVNNSSEKLNLISSSLTGNSNANNLTNLPQTIPSGTTTAFLTVAPASDTSYTAVWTYSPDNGATLLTFNCFIAGSSEFDCNITPSMTGTSAAYWLLAEGTPIWTFYYYPVIAETLTVSGNVINGPAINLTTANNGEYIQFNASDFMLSSVNASPTTPALFSDFPNADNNWVGILVSDLSKCDKSYTVGFQGNTGNGSRDECSGNVTITVNVSTEV
jgi:hypothetical protein